MLNEVGVDVIIPVYNQLDLVRQCLDSILASPCKIDRRIVVIDDASPDVAVSAYLESVARSGAILLLRNEVNLGFTRTVNRGMQLSHDRDVLLLNSDTIVYGDWLDRLATAAYSDPRIATVNPMTNTGGSHISPYPSLSVNDDIPVELHRELDAIANAENAARYALVHTTVGFCMYIKRACLREIGVFDALNFPVAYGEETDACYRARKMGWKHLIAGDTFVSHLEGKSFGARKQQLMADMIGRFRRLHPELDELDARCKKQDPLARLRRGIDLGRLKSSLKSEKSISLTASTTKTRQTKLETFDGLVFDRVERSIHFAGCYRSVSHDLGPYTMPIDICQFNHDLARIGIESIACDDPATSEQLKSVCAGLSGEMTLSAQLATPTQT